LVYLRISLKIVLHINFCIYYALYDTGKGKGKAIPLQALAGPEDFRRMRLPDFKTIGT
jgi:hypothetical protein